MDIREAWKILYRGARLSRKDREAFVEHTRKRAQALLEECFERRVQGYQDLPGKTFDDAVAYARRVQRFTVHDTTIEGMGRLKCLERFAETCDPRRHIRRVVGLCPVTNKAFKWADGKYVDANGLGQLVEEGASVFEAATECRCIPHNLVFTEMSGALDIGPAPFRFGGRRLSPKGADRLLREYGRIRGWLIAAARFRAVTRVIMKTQTARGVNSPYLQLNLPELWGKYPSPGRLERKLWAVRRRVEAILSAYRGDYNPSWRSVAHGLLISSQVGKAAVIAVAETLAARGEYREHHEEPEFFRYSAARDFLVEVRSAAWPAGDNSDGVEARREAEPRLSKMGISVYRARVVEPFGRFSLKWLVRTDAGRTFHSEWGGPEEALHDAIRAWKRQNELAAENADIVSFLNGDELGFCPLITRKDSYEAGNCRVGTESWARQQGWDDREFVPGVWLIHHLHDEEVIRVASAARERWINR